MPTFLSFPIGGQIVVWIVGPINNSFDAVLGGLIVGIVLGVAQYWALRPVQISRGWILLTPLSLGVGSLLAWNVISFVPSIFNLSMWGLIAGLILGLGQALSQRLLPVKTLIWTASVSIAWGFAWFISANVIVDQESNYAVFGSTGALLATGILAFVINPIFTIQDRSQA